MSGLWKSTAFKYGAAVVVIAALVIIAVSRGNGDEVETLIVARGDFVQEVSVSGKVIAAQEVDLSFPETGRVASIAVDVGDTVVAGQALSSLASPSLISQLRAAEADLALKRAETKNTNVNLDEVRREQDTLVASAKRKLLSTDLTAVPVFSSAYAVDAPTISGIYDGEEGVYRMSVERSVNPTKYELKTFRLENTQGTIIEEGEPTKLGTRGLYVSFPEDIDLYNNTTWEITVPNKKSDSYLADYNAYQEALRTSDVRIGEAEADLREGPSGSVANAEVQRAEAEVAQIRASITERTIRAPFSGVVTVVEIELGETVAANAQAISLISAGALQIESFVPEVNIALIEVGDISEVTLDAYGMDAVFMAKVVSIDPAETVRDGVSTYRALMQFEQKDERIRTGMTANVRIKTDEREGVISVPQGLVFGRDGKKYVRVMEGEEPAEREVTTGSVSSLGDVEILTGLSEGDAVVLESPQ